MTCLFVCLFVCLFGMFRMFRMDRSFILTFHNYFRGQGDLHAAQFSKYRQMISLTRPGMFSDKSPSFTLTVYPSDEFFKVYSTANPITATVGSVCIIIFTSLLFLLYDFFVRQESHHKQARLKATRKFTRFVSHEVRTPLNAACKLVPRCLLSVRLLSDHFLPVSILSLTFLSALVIRLGTSFYAGRA